METNSPEERVLVIAPVGQDARVMAELLMKHGFTACVCSGPEECFTHLGAGAGALILTEEALEMRGAFRLLDTLKQQPAWSELPVIILAAGGESQVGRLVDLAMAAAGSVTLLERPIKTITLLRSVEVALQSRRRQYQVRDLLEEQRRAEAQLRQAHERLAGHARELETVVQRRTASLADSYDRLRNEMAERAAAEAAREALRRQLLNAQEEERRRIARELHDQMGQNLTALHLGLKSLQESEACCNQLPSLVEPLQQLAAQTARDLHRVALELRPAALDDLGLIKALRQLVETWSARSRIEADLETTGYNPTGVSPEMKTALYRIIQEALNNVAKHSGAKHVSIILRRTAAHVQAMIEDDGHGFDAETEMEAARGRGRLGLVGIEERLAVIAGKLNVESAPGRGTTLVVRMPMPEKTP
jgi:signal transduction histidine kinase